MILWIDKNTFASSLVEKVFKKRSQEFYSLTNVDDFLYLVEDLKPRAIVLDEATYLLNPKAFIEQYEQSPNLQKTPFIFLDEKIGMSFTPNKIGAISRPFDPFLIPELIEHFLNGN